MKIANKFESIVFDYGNIGFSIITLNGTIIKANHSFCDMFGYTSDELEHVTWFDLLLQDEVTPEKKSMLTLFRNRENETSYERIGVKKDGSLLSLLLSKSLYVEEDTKKEYVLYSCQDITKQKNAVDELFQLCVKREKELEFHLKIEEKLRRENQELENSLIFDDLTGAYNRKFLINHINNIEQKKESQCSLIMCDIDNFKKINDSYGHYCGDYVLQKTVELIKKNCRKVDCLSRWGGEEFLIYLPNTTKEEAKKIAERIREKVSNNLIQFNEQIIRVTITLGLSEYNGTNVLSEAIQKADFALLEGKQEGKNRVIAC